MRKRAAFALLLIVALFHIPGWGQCAMCRTALESSPEGQALAGSFRYGILLLMGAPYVMLSAAGYAIFRASRKKKNTDSADSTD
jgi:hypothetical protein